MKGDLFLLGAVGAAMAAIPAAVLLWAGQPLLGELSPALQTVLPASQSGKEAAVGTNQGAFSQPAPERKESSEDPAASPPAGDGSAQTAQGEESAPQEEALPPLVKEVWHSPVTTLKILDRGAGEVVELSLADYTRYAIAAEMPADYHLEALKAQGVAALTYALRQAMDQRSLPEEARDPALRGADFAADPENRRGYMTEDTAREFYGEQFDYSWSRITQAARVACRCVALYEGEPIAAAYHAISAGETTERAENIWEGPLPYLVEADSSWDILTPGYKSTFAITDGELKELLTAAGAVLLPDPATWLSIEERSPAGYVTRIRAGSLLLHGNQLRNLLGLRSCAFELERTRNGYTFYVRGYGHGAGLSQAGADYLARQGEGFDEILLHYYSGITLAEVGVAGDSL